MTETAESAPPVVHAPPVVAPSWRRAKLWLGLGVVVVVTAVLVASLSQRPGRPMDPRSASPDGSRALVQLLTDRAVTVHRTTAIADLGAGRAVVVPFPDDYSNAQLRDLAAGHRLVVVQPGPDPLRTLAPTLAADRSDDSATTVDPDCALPGPQATGPVEFPAGTDGYDGANCYTGRASIAARLVVLGSDRLLRNDELSRVGVAALDLNAITADGTVSDVDWLLPGADAHGNGPPSIWLVLPGWTPRAVMWALLVGLLLALWRGRRLGPIVAEPLPVIVRSAEIVEGHGRLYQRAAARDGAAARARAAAELRAGALRRLRTELSLPRSATPTEIVAAAAVATVRAPQRVHAVLLGPPPTDDAMLVDLATSLADLHREGTSA
jgi:hypothetical protein